MQKFQVTGMSCAACQARVEKAVAKVPGVTSVAVSLLTNTMGVEGTASDADIVAAVVAAGYGASSMDQAASTGTKEKKTDSQDAAILKDTETPVLVRRLILSAFFLLVLMYITMGHHMLGLPIPEALCGNYTVLALIQLLLSAIVMLINHKFFTNGIGSLRHGAPNMDTLVALGSGVSFVWSVWVLFQMLGISSSVLSGASVDVTAAHDRVMDLYHNQLYFESAAMIPALITVGKTLESISKGRTTDALKSLLRMAPKTARVRRPAASCEAASEEVCAITYEEKEIPVEQVQVDDIFVVRPGDAIPVDGVVIEGESAVNESALTGESIPVDKAPGANVAAGTINQSGFLTCRATRVGEDTTLAKIIQLVSDASATKAPIARIADRVSGIFVPAVIGIALLVILIWILLGRSAGFALARGISVLVISCPCALGLATPVAIMVGSGVGAKNGILIKTGEALETTGRAKVIALDKTGTITKGEPEVTAILPAEKTTEEELLLAALALERKSEHPLAKAIVKEGERRKIDASRIEDVTDFLAHAGHGLEGRMNDRLVHGGNAAFIRAYAAIPETVSTQAENLAKKGQTPLYFEADGTLLGVIGVADRVKEDSSEGIRQLKKLGLRVVMLTGDNEHTAKAIAAEAGVDDVVAGVLPDGKADVVKDLQKDGAVLMVGDGINDAPALTTADVGIAIGAGTDVAIESADVVLMHSSLRDVAAAVRLSRTTLRNIHENLFWAFFYNVICIPIAAGVLSWKMNPMIGAAAMSISSFTVCMNALRLNLFQVHERRKTMEKTLKIEGMMCGHCEASVKQALEALPFITSCIPDHNTNTAKITVDGAFDEETVKNTIEGKGYTYHGEA